MFQRVKVLYLFRVILSSQENVRHFRHFKTIDYSELKDTTQVKELLKFILLNILPNMNQRKIIHIKLLAY